MLRKIASLVSLLILFAWLSPVSAAKPNFVPDLPETDGVYDVPDRPDLKVRVFVHNPKGKPALTATLGICSDSLSSAVVGSAGWKMAGARTYKVNPAVPTAIKSGLDAIISNSFDAWMATTELKNFITLSYGGTTKINRAVYDGQNIIAWGKTSNSALGVTYTWYNKTTGISVESDTIMNQKFPWSWNICTSSTAYDAQNILTHELGHWFGLNDHYTAAYAENTMYGYGSKGETKKDTLTQGDINGTNTLY